MTINVFLKIQENAFEALLANTLKDNYRPTAGDKVLFSHDGWEAFDKESLKRGTGAKFLRKSVYVENLLEARSVPGTSILAAWDCDTGLPVGKNFKQNPDGTIDRGVVEGSETEETKAENLDYMPDLVTYDNDGLETSRTRPLAFDPATVNIRFGQAARIR